MDLICWIPNFGNQIPNLTFTIHACIDLAAKTLALKYISAYNYFMLTNAGMPRSNNFDLCAIAYLRALVVSKGVSKHQANPAAKDCIYTLFREGPFSLSAILLANIAEIDNCVVFTNGNRPGGAPAVTRADLTYAEVAAY